MTGSEIGGARSGCLQALYHSALKCGVGFGELQGLVLFPLWILIFPSKRVQIRTRGGLAPCSSLPCETVELSMRVVLLAVLAAARGQLQGAPVRERLRLR